MRSYSSDGTGGIRCGKGRNGCSKIEKREPLRAPLDLLAQHLITLALGGGFKEKDTLEEVRTAWSYRDLTLEEWGWTLDFVIRGGSTLKAYDQFKRVVVKNGYHTVESKLIGRFHRMSIGTITSDQAITVKFKTERTLEQLRNRSFPALSQSLTFSFQVNFYGLKESGI